MAKEKEAKGGGVGLWGWILLALLVPIGMLTWNCGRNWNVTAVKERELAEEMVRLGDRNRQLAPFYEVLKNRKYQICNRSADIVTLNWLATTYNEGQQIKVFDSSRCQDWKPIVLQPGENRFVTLSSVQEGCNWNGSVMYVTVAYTREKTEQTDFFEDVEVFRVFDADRECQNIQ
jgi:hypothetical protein